MVAALAGLVPFQVAFVVRDLERAVRDFDGVLGAGPWRGYVFDGGSVEGREYETADALGFIVEAADPSSGLPEPAFRL